MLQSEVKTLRKRKAELENQVTELEKAVTKTKDNLSDDGYHEIRVVRPLSALYH